MKVYIVTRGDYSDYTIVGATLDKNIAKNIAMLYSDDFDQANVETWDLDEFNGHERPLWYVYFYKDRKPVVERHIYGSYADANKVCPAPNNMYGYEYVVYPTADDENHALKIAEDLLAKYKAEQAGLI